MTTSFAAHNARIVALALADLDEGLRDLCVEESYVPGEWVEQS